VKGGVNQLASKAKNNPLCRLLPPPVWAGKREGVGDGRIFALIQTKLVPLRES
jgi:hypothetical protein